MRGSSAVDYKNFNVTSKKNNFFNSIKSIDKKSYERNRKKGLILEIPVNDDINIKGEMAMWKAVIMQALVDVASKSNKKMSRVNRLKSGKWLNLRNRNFLNVCSYAELDPEYVVQKAEKIKEQNPLFPSF